MGVGVGFLHLVIKKDDAEVFFMVLAFSCGGVAHGQCSASRTFVLSARLPWGLSGNCPRMVCQGPSRPLERWGRFNWRTGRLGSLGIRRQLFPRAAGSFQGQLGRKAGAFLVRQDLVYTGSPSRPPEPPLPPAGYREPGAGNGFPGCALRRRVYAHIWGVDSRARL